jgi:uncharacterized membrane protein YozB (DUF420 family)
MTFDITYLATLNAMLNASSSVLLAIGYALIRRGRIAAHRRFMIGACLASTLFLISYVVYHANIGSRPFEGQGWVRPVYFTILISHVMLAAVVLPMGIVTLRRGLAGRFDRHVRIARWTYPLWLYVSVTGVIVYVMLYHWP